jgi:hypothetical protein
MMAWTGEEAKSLGFRNIPEAATEMVQMFNADAVKKAVSICDCDCINDHVPRLEHFEV